MKTILVGHQHTEMMVKPGHYKIKFPDIQYSFSTMSERAEQITKDLDLEAKLRFYENWAVINDHFVFSDGSEIEVAVK